MVANNSTIEIEYDCLLNENEDEKFDRIYKQCVPYKDMTNKKITEIITEKELDLNRKYEIRGRIKYERKKDNLNFKKDEIEEYVIENIEKRFESEWTTPLVVEGFITLKVGFSNEIKTINISPNNCNLKYLTNEIQRLFQIAIENGKYLKLRLQDNNANQIEENIDNNIFKNYNICNNPKYVIVGKVKVQIQEEDVKIETEVKSNNNKITNRTDVMSTSMDNNNNNNESFNKNSKPLEKLSFSVSHESSGKKKNIDER